MRKLIKYISAITLLVMVLVQSAACKKTVTEPVSGSGDTSLVSSNSTDVRKNAESSEWSEETSGTRHKESFTMEFTYYSSDTDDNDESIKYIIDLCGPMTSERFTELLYSQSDKVVGLSQQLSDYKGFALLGYQTVDIGYETKEITARSGDVILTKDHHILIAYGEGKINGVKIASLNGYKDELRKIAGTYDVINVWISITVYGY